MELPGIGEETSVLQAANDGSGTKPLELSDIGVRELLPQTVNIEEVYPWKLMMWASCTLYNNFPKFCHITDNFWPPL